MKALFRRWFRVYLRRLLAQKLDGLFVYGLAGLRAAMRQGPVVLAANHVCRWDALVLARVEEELGDGGWVLMDAENLRQRRFFAAFGAIPLDRSSAWTARAGLRDARARLQRPGDRLWIFPQGRQRPQQVRPLGLAGGLRMLLPATVIPISFSYHFRESFAPAAFVRVGEPVEGTSLLENLETWMLQGLSENLRAAEGAMEGYEPLIAPPPPAGVGLPERLLSRFWALQDRS